MSTTFLFKVHSYSDVITNSSSELFIINQGKKSKEEIISIISSIYPDWRTEYEEPVPFSDIRDWELDYLIGYDYYRNDMLYEFTHSYTDINKGVKEFNEYFKTAKYKTWSAKKAKDYNLTPEEFWDGFDTWAAKVNTTTWGSFASLPALDISDKGRKAIESEYTDTWLLRSIDENPNWDYQELLEQIAIRLHLG